MMRSLIECLVAYVLYAGTFVSIAYADNTGYLTNQPAKESQLSGNANLIKAVVYKDIIEKQNHVTGTNIFTLYCLDEDKSESHLLSIFTNSVPRIELGTDNVAFSKYTMTDKLTAKPAKLFWVKIKSISDHSAEVYVGWRTGARSSENFLYKLRFENGRWIIAERKETSIS